MKAGIVTLAVFAVTGATFVLRPPSALPEPDALEGVYERPCGPGVTCTGVLSVVHETLQVAVTASRIHRDGRREPVCSNVGDEGDMPGVGTSGGEGVRLEVSGSCPADVVLSGSYERVDDPADGSRP